MIVRRLAWSLFGIPSVALVRLDGAALILYVRNSGERPFVRPYPIGSLGGPERQFLYAGGETQQAHTYARWFPLIGAVSAPPPADQKAVA